MADAKDPTVTSGGEAANEAAPPIDEADDGNVSNFTSGYEEMPEKPSKDTVAQVEVLDEKLVAQRETGASQDILAADAKAAKGK